MRRIGWLADPHSWGPLTRAVAVLGVTDGIVLSQRSPVEAEPLQLERIEWRRAGCCGPERPEVMLADLDADVLVADPGWWRLAQCDGRPLLRIGFATSGPTAPDVDLDQLPIHPWAWWPLPTRGEVRERWGIGDGRPVVATMSPSTIPRWVELRIAEWLPPDAELRVLEGWRSSLEMVGADLIVTSSGWASSWEARWSGVPYVLLSTGSPDAELRATHTLDQARHQVAAVTPAWLDDDHRALPDTHLPTFLSILRSLERLAVG